MGLYSGCYLTIAMEDLHSYVSAVLAVLLGAVFAGLYTSYLNHLASKNEIIKDYLSELDIIQELSGTYWLCETAESSSASHEKVGHELRARVEATGRYADLTQNILGALCEEFEALDTRLAMVATGGTFQTSEHCRSPETYSEIAQILTDMRFLLRSKRNKMFWAG